MIGPEKSTCILTQGFPGHFHGYTDASGGILLSLSDNCHSYRHMTQYQKSFLCCSVNGSVCEFFGKQFAIILGVVVILLLNLMELLSVGGTALLDRLCMVFQ